MTQSTSSSQPVQITVTGGGDVFGADSAANRNLARRVRACVNACEGLSTEDLELGIVGQMRQIIQTLAPAAAEAARRKDAERAA